MIERLKAILKSDDFIPTSAVFPSIDADHIARDLRLKVHGSDRGKRDLPRSGEQSLDAIEMSVVDRVEELRRKGLENYDANKEVYAKRLSLASTAHLEVKSVAGSARGDFETVVRAYQAQMSKPVARLREWKRALDSFRNKHKRERPAYPRANVVVTAVILLVCVMVETILNGYLFAEKNDLGYLGGFLVAGLVSIVNVGMASLAGFFSRLSRHCNYAVKLWGAIIIIGWLALAGTINLSLAHFRDAIETHDSWSAAASVAVSQFTEAPLILTQVESWLLFVWGCLVALFAFLKFAVFSGEPYPGYGRIFHAYESALDDYTSMLEDALGSLREKRDEVIDELKDANRLVREQIGDAVDALHGQQLMRSHLAAFLQQCDLKTNALLKIYRDENRATRKSDAPEHFDAAFSFAPFADSELDDQHRKDADRTLREINEIINDAIDGIHSDYLSLMEEYPEAHSLIGMDLSSGEPLISKPEPVLQARARSGERLGVVADRESS